MGKIMLNGTQYGVGGIEQAKDISYDNTESGATATDVQGALDELNNGLMWKPLSSGVASSVRTSLSSVDYRELLLVARISNAAYTIIALKTEIDAGQTLWSSGVFFRSGTWVGVQFGVDQSNNEVYMSYANNSGTDVLASAKYSIYYR